MKTVKKKWGKEVWLVNNDKYCAKFLYVDKGAQSSYHYHPIKQETFIPWEGEVLLNIKGTEFILEEPYTINPNTPHSFYGITDAVILEVSTPHSDEDIVRLTESKEICWLCGELIDGCPSNYTHNGTTYPAHFGCVEGAIQSGHNAVRKLHGLEEV